MEREKRIRHDSVARESWTENEYCMDKENRKVD